MADFTEKFIEVHEPLYVLHPISVTNGAAVYTSYVSLANYHRAFILINVGVMQSGATLDAVVYQAVDTAGSGTPKVLSPTKAITQLTQAGSDSNSIVGIEIRTEELDVTNGFDCIALAYTVGTAAIIMSIEIWGCVPRYAPAPVTDWNEVVA